MAEQLWVADAASDALSVVNTTSMAVRQLADRAPFHYMDKVSSLSFDSSTPLPQLDLDGDADVLPDQLGLRLALPRQAGPEPRQDLAAVGPQSHVRVLHRVVGRRVATKNTRKTKKRHKTPRFESDASLFAALREY